MGYRGTVNTVLSFGEGAHCPGGEPGAIGYLVGQEGTGLACMFHMMNEARIGVGAGAAAVGYTGYLHARRYAQTRLQGRAATGGGDAPSAVPIIRHPDVRRMLMASKCYVEGGLALVLYAARLLDEERSAEDRVSRDEAHLLLDLLTPIVKSWPSQWCLLANDHAIQIHGGYGYARDYPVEQFYRDNRLNAIHEGTHGIQALDLLGRKVGASGGTAFALLIARMRATVSRARSSEELVGPAGELERVVSRLSDVTDRLLAGDRASMLSHATTFLEASGHVVVAWLWLDQALATIGKSGAFYDGKRAAMRFFFGYELPRVSTQLDLLESGDRTLLDLDEGWFSSFSSSP
jgi:butyryl-CoA dehydrogenase